MVIRIMVNVMSSTRWPVVHFKVKVCGSTENEDEENGHYLADTTHTSLYMVCLDTTLCRVVQPCSWRGTSRFSLQSLFSTVKKQTII